MRPSWIPLFVALIGIGCGMFALFPPRWSPDLGQGILAGMAMYFVGLPPAIAQARASTGLIPPLFGPQGIMAGVLARVLRFLIILVAIAYVFFDRRSFWDITWPVLILASWSLADSTASRAKR
jgi:hypothetical protein